MFLGSLLLYLKSVLLSVCKSVCSLNLFSSLHLFLSTYSWYYYKWCHFPYVIVDHFLQVHRGTANLYIEPGSVSFELHCSKIFSGFLQLSPWKIISPLSRDFKIIFQYEHLLFPFFEIFGAQDDYRLIPCRCIYGLRKFPALVYLVAACNPKTQSNAFSASLKCCTLSFFYEVCFYK